MALNREGRFGPPTRVVNIDFNVIEQDTYLKELTGVNANSREVKCHKQLSGPICQTDEYPLKGLNGRDEEKRVRYSDREMIVTEVDMKTPNGSLSFEHPDSGGATVKIELPRA